MIFRESGKKAETVPTLSVIGMDAVFGKWDGLSVVKDTLYFGRNGASVENENLIDAEMIRFAPFGFAFVDRIQTTPEQKTGLLSGLRALKDAGINLMKLAEQKIAVLYASSSGNEMLSYQYGIDQLEDHLKKPVNELEEILVMAGIKGGIYDLSNFASPLTAGIMLAEKVLRTGKADMVALVMVGLGEITGSIKDGIPGIDKTTDGCGAVILQTSQKAKKQQRKRYCQIQSMAVSGGSTVEGGWQQLQKRASRNLNDLLEMTSTTINEIGTIEVSDNGDGRMLSLTTKAINSPLQMGGFAQPTTAIATIENAFGYLNNANEMASFIKMILQISERIICGSQQYGNLSQVYQYHGSQLYVAEESKTWFRKKYQSERLGLVALIHPNGSCTHLLLSEVENNLEQYAPASARIEQFLIPICGDSEEELMEQLGYLKASLNKPMNLNQMQQFWIRKWERRKNPVFTAVFLGADYSDFLRELSFAEVGLPKAIDRGSDWQTPAGSFFSPNPLGAEGKVAFVYPGAFNSQIYSGKDLFYSFPDLHRFSKRFTDSIGDVLCEDRLYPRSQKNLTEEMLVELNQQLVEDAIVMLSSGTALAALNTLVLKEIFGVRPVMSFGYSLGENSMMFSSGVWNSGDDAMHRLEQSDLFRERISGKQMAVREFWAEADEVYEPAWVNYVLMGDADSLKEKLEQTDKVYLTHINTSRQVVIGGHPQACETFIAENRLNSIKAPFNHALHCEPVQPEWSEFRYLHHWPVFEKPDHDLYTAAGYDISGISSDEIADNIADALTQPLDFPKLVNKVYEDGARIFIECGAGSNCSKWVDQILKKKDHISMSASINGVRDGNAILRVLAKCVSHSVPVALDALYANQNINQVITVKEAT